MTAPLLVVETGAYADYLERARALGWCIVVGWEATPPADTPPSSVIVTDRVDGLPGAAGAVRRAMEGFGVLAHGTAPRDVLDVLCDDLRRFGPVRHVVEPRGEPVLDGEKSAVMELTAAGRSVGDIAARLHLSRRTVHRRLAEIRSLYGVGSTAAAIAAHRARSGPADLAPPADPR